MKNARWEKADDDYIRENYDMPDEVIAEALDRTTRGIYERRRTLNIPPFNYEGIRKPMPMSKYEKEYRIVKMAAEMHVRLEG